MIMKRKDESDAAEASRQRRRELTGTQFFAPSVEPTPNTGPNLGRRRKFSKYPATLSDISETELVAIHR